MSDSKLIDELCGSFDPDGIPVDDSEVRLVQERARRLEAHPEDEMDWGPIRCLYGCPPLLHFRRDPTLIQTRAA